MNESFSRDHFVPREGQAFVESLEIHVPVVIDGG